jgi:hypothetical protein
MTSGDANAMPSAQVGQELGIDIGRVGMSGRSCQRRDHQYNAGSQL